MSATTRAHGVAILGLVATIPEVANCGAYRDAELHTQIQNRECAFLTIGLQVAGNSDRTQYYIAKRM